MTSSSSDSERVAFRARWRWWCACAPLHLSSSAGVYKMLKSGLDNDIPPIIENKEKSRAALASLTGFVLVTPESGLLCLCLLTISVTMPWLGTSCRFVYVCVSELLSGCLIVGPLSHRSTAAGARWRR